jgi:hypothetical protein
MMWSLAKKSSFPAPSGYLGCAEFLYNLCMAIQPFLTKLYSCGRLHAFVVSFDLMTRQHGVPRRRAVQRASTKCIRK